METTIGSLTAPGPARTGRSGSHRARARPIANPPYPRPLERSTSRTPTRRPGRRGPAGRPGRSLGHPWRRLNPARANTDAVVSLARQVEAVGQAGGHDGQLGVLLGVGAEEPRDRIAFGVDDDPHPLGLALDGPRHVAHQALLPGQSSMWNRSFGGVMAPGSPQSGQRNRSAWRRRLSFSAAIRARASSSVSPSATTSVS